DRGLLDARALARDEARVCLRSAATSRARLALLLERVEPGLRRLLGGGAGLRRLLLHECVERNVADAAGFGDDVPLDRLNRIGFATASDRKNIGEAVLRDRVALAGRFCQQGRRQPLVSGNA